MKWYKWISRQGVDLTTLEYVDQAFFTLINEYTRRFQENFFTTLEDKVFTHYTRVNLDKVGMYLYNKYWSKPEQFEKYYTQSLKDNKQNELMAKNWRKKLLKNQSTKALAAALKDFKTNFIKFNYHYSIAPFLPFEFWQIDFEKAISPLLNGKSAFGRELILNSLTKPWKKTYLADLKDKIEKWNKEKILKQSQFLRSWSIIWFEPLGNDWAKSLESGLTAEVKKQKLLSSAELIKKLKPNKKQAGFIKIAPYIAFYKDWRDELRRRQVYSWSFLFDKIANILDIPRVQLGYLTFNEISKFLTLGKIDKKLIQQRSKKLILVTSQPGNIKPLVVDKNAGKYLKIIRSLELKEELKTIKGLAAFPGKVVGRVKIIKTAKDLAKFRKGEIFVANTTHPNYLPAMQKALAIVTNEGGIMCHAAITAREMKKPCIVGTKIATKVLHDGDLVEVDADKDIVRVLKSN